MIEGRLHWRVGQVELLVTWFA